jgi:hypothetical protein
MTASEYLQLPDKRDWKVFPPDAEEQAAEARFDAEDHSDLPDIAFTLILKWHSVNNYKMSDPSFKSALISIRPLLGTVPQSVPDPNAALNTESARIWRESQGMVRHGEERDAENRAAAEKRAKDEAAERKHFDDMVKNIIEGDQSFEKRCSKIHDLVIGHPSGRPDWYKTVNAQQEAFNKLRTEFPDHSAEIDAEITALNARFRM